MTREEAIKDIQDNILPVVGGKSLVMAISALRQPDIIRCKDCRYHWTYKCMDGMPTERCELEQTFYDANIDYCSLAVRRGVT